MHDLATMWRDRNDCPHLRMTSLIHQNITVCGITPVIRLVPVQTFLQTFLVCPHGTVQATELCRCISFRGFRGHDLVRRAVFTPPSERQHGKGSSSSRLSWCVSPFASLLTFLRMRHRCNCVRWKTNCHRNGKQRNADMGRQSSATSNWYCIH